MQAIAKNDYNVTEDDGSVRTFSKSKTYRCTKMGDSFFLIDDNRYGYKCDSKEFTEHFIEKG